MRPAWGRLCSKASSGSGSNSLESRVRENFSLDSCMKPTLWTNHQTSTLFCPSIDGLDDINQLLFIFEHPVQLVVVAGAKITHHMLVSEEEHECHRVVQFIHLFEVRHLIEITDIDHCKVFDTVRDACNALPIRRTTFKWE